MVGNKTKAGVVFSKAPLTGADGDGFTEPGGSRRNSA